MTKEKEIISTRLYQAMQLAFNLHGRDSRKGSEVPYLSHLFSVCALVQMDGGDEDEAIAALLHDTLEDKADRIDGEFIANRFGKKVLEIIRISSDTPDDYQGGEKPPWMKRKLTYLEHVLTIKDPTLLRVTVADKVDNARAILADHKRIGNRLWKRFNASKENILWYYQACENAYKAVKFSGPLMEELEHLVDEMENRIKGL